MFQTFAGGTLSAIPAGVLYAQTGPQPSAVAGFSLLTQPIHYQTAPLNAAVKSSTGEQTTEQMSQEQQQQAQTQAQQHEQEASQQPDDNDMQAVPNITFATGNAFSSGSYAGVIPAAQAYGNAYIAQAAQPPGVAGKESCVVLSYYKLQNLRVCFLCCFILARLISLAKFVIH